MFRNKLYGSKIQLSTVFVSFLGSHTVVQTCSEEELFKKKRARQAVARAPLLTACAAIDQILVAVVRVSIKVLAFSPLLFRRFGLSCP